MITCQRRRLRTAAGGGVDADHSLSGAPCPPSLPRSDTHEQRPSEEVLPERDGQDGAAGHEGTLSAAPSATAAFRRLTL